MAGRTRSKEAARKALRMPGVGRTVGRLMGVLATGSATAAPTLASIYRRLPSSGGLPPGITVEQQRAALLRYYARLDDLVAAVDYRPTISVLVPTYRPDYRYLQEMLGSVAMQTYPDWQLCIVDDASGDDVVTDLLADFAAAHPGKVAWATRTENGHIAAASNDALELAAGDYVALLDHDDRLYPHALAEVVLGIDRARSDEGALPLVLYTDERMIDEEGRPIGEVWLKPDWMPLLHLTSNYTNHLTVYSRDLLAQLGGFRTGFDGSQDHDLMLRATEASEAADRPIVHVPSIAYQWRSHPGSVAKDPGIKAYSVSPAMRAVAQACERRGRPARVWREPGFVANRIDFDLPSPRPSVEVAVLPRNGDAGRSIASFRTDPYPDVTWTDVDPLLPPAAGLQRILAECRADVLVVLADDLDATRDDWLTAMVSLLTLPEVSAVGGLLLTPAGLVAAAGYVGVGAAGVAPAMAGRAPTEEVYLAWPASIHEVLAVPGVAAAYDVAALRAAGGFLDCPDLLHQGWDADACLRLRATGRTTVFTPYAQFRLQHEPAARLGAGDITVAARAALVRRWPKELIADPYLNPGLARTSAFDVDPGLLLPEVPAELFDTWLLSHRVS